MAIGDDEAVVADGSRGEFDAWTTITGLLDGAIGWWAILEDRPSAEWASDADREFADGVHDYWSGAPLMARVRWQAAAASGSGQAAMALWALDRTDDDLLNTADEGGSAFAAAFLMAAAIGNGDTAGAHAAFRRARSGAEASAAHGSAGAAYLLAVLTHVSGDIEAVRLALRRADELGSAPGAVLLGCYQELAGDPGQAELTYQRALRRGFAPAGISLARLLDGRGRHRLSRRARRETMKIAAGSGDTDTYVAARNLLAPPVSDLVRVHPWRTSLLVVCAAVVALLHWQWLVPAALAAVAARMLRVTPYPGAPATPAGSPDDRAVHVGTVSLDARLDGGPLVSAPTAVTARCTAWGRYLYLGWAGLCLVASVVTAAWAAERVGVDLLARLGLVALGISTLVPLLTKYAFGEPVEAPPGRDHLELRLGVGLGFAGLGLRLAYRGQHLEELYEVLHPSQGSERLAAWRTTTTRLVIACLLFAEAIWWGDRGELAGSRAILTAGLEMALCAYAASVGLFRVHLGLSRRSAMHVFVGVVQLVALALLVAVAAHFDLLAGWSEFWSAIGGN